MTTEQFVEYRGSADSSTVIRVSLRDGEEVLAFVPTQGNSKDSQEFQEWLLGKPENVPVPYIPPPPFVDPVKEELAMIRTVILASEGKRSISPQEKNRLLEDLLKKAE